jgi:hypothetical protein
VREEIFGWEGRRRRWWWWWWWCVVSGDETRLFVFSVREESEREREGERGRGQLQRGECKVEGSAGGGWFISETDHPELGT